MPTPLPPTIAAARQCLAQGRRADAELLCRQILAAQPHHLPALELLGMLLAQSGRNLEALLAYQQAVALQPDFAEGHATMGSLLSVLGRHAEAAASFQLALRLKPALVDVHYFLGNALLALQRDAEAELAYRQAMQFLPRHAETRNNLGTLLKKRGLLPEARACFQDAITLRPDFAEAHANLGATFEQLGLFDQALACHQRALALRPDHPDMHLRLGVTLAALNRHDDALAAFDRALALRPDHADAWNNKGISLRMLGQVDAAVAAFRRAAAADPANADPWTNLGVLLDLKGERVEALACYRRALTLRPNDPAAHSNLLYALHFHPAITPQSLLEEHRTWDRLHAAPFRAAITPHPNSRDPDRRLRIGYVSPDFRDHPVGRFMAPLIAAHDPTAVEVFCYPDILNSDPITHTIAHHCHHWRPITGMNHDQAAALIRHDQIDILVDLTMHMSGSRLLVFARKPAPVQATYLAYCSTTGLATIDYRLSDPFLDPPDSDTSIYSEQTLRIPHYWCYAPSDLAPPPNPLPAASTGTITFGCLNGFNKVSDDALATWAAILAEVPNSRLLLHANPGTHRDRVHHTLANLGIDPHRCKFLPLASLPDYFLHYHLLDIALDPFPYAGGTTSCDALWMGVPVITLAGTRAVGRGGVSILSTLNLPDWIATTPASYIQIAATLARNPAHLATLRQSLRPRMLQSPLMNAPTFAHSIESAFRQMWRSYCAISS